MAMDKGDGSLVKALGMKASRPEFKSPEST